MGSHIKSKEPLHQATEEILDSIRRIVRALRVSSKAAERDLGLSSAQLYVLQKLRDEKGVSVNELASLTLTHQSSVSVVVSKLVEQGYVQRRKSKEDERRSEISITIAGLALIKRAPEPIQERLIAAIESLPLNSREDLSQYLRVIVENAGISEGPAPLFFEEK
jgi:DNA-binding MarR family transcriptional regulator